jgi:hypothetical protein
LLVLAVLASAQVPDLSEGRAIRLRKQSGSVTFEVDLIRGAERATVPTTFQFQSGDRFALRIQVTSDAYLYVLNRTFVGSPDTLKESNRVRVARNVSGEVATADPPFTLVYPPNGHRLVKAGQTNLIPGVGLAMEMDDHPGVEQLLLVVSPVRLDVQAILSSSTSAVPVRKEKASPRKVAAPEGQAQPVHTLEEMAGNVEVVEVPSAERDLTVELLTMPKPRTGVAAPKVRREPYLVDIVLAHYPA